VQGIPGPIDNPAAAGAHGRTSAGAWLEVLQLTGGIMKGPLTTHDLEVPQGNHFSCYGLLSVPALQSAPGNDMTGSSLPPGVAQPLIQVFKPSGSGNAPALTIENFSTGNSLYIHSSGNPRLVVGPDGPITLYRPDSTPAITINASGATSQSTAAVDINATGVQNLGGPVNAVMVRNGSTNHFVFRNDGTVALSPAAVAGLKAALGI